MKIVLKDKVLMVKKNEGSELSQDMYTVKDDNDKNLITCTVLEGTEEFQKGTVIITGKYSLNKLTYKSEDYYFIEDVDVVGIIKD